MFQLDFRVFLILSKYKGFREPSLKHAHIIRTYHVLSKYTITPLPQFLVYKTSKFNRLLRTKS